MEKPAKRCHEHPMGDLMLQLTPDKPHFGKWVCAECTAFIQMARHPKTTEEMVSRQNRIIKIIREYGNMYLPGQTGDGTPYLTETDLKKLLWIYGQPRLGLLVLNQWHQLLEKYITED